MENHIEEIESSSKRDKGFTLVELLIVIVILGILATVTVFAVRGITDKGQTSACGADLKTLQTASESYFAQYGGSTIVVSPATIPGTTIVGGATAEATLVAAQFLRGLSPKYDVNTAGQVVYVATPEGTACLNGNTAGAIAG